MDRQFRMGRIYVPREFYAVGDANPFDGHPRERDLFVHLLANANYADTQKLRRGRLLSVKRGQLPLGREKLAAAMGFSVREIRTLLSNLQKLGKIDQQSDQLGTIVTIRDYDEITGTVAGSDQPFDPLATSQRPASDHSRRKGNKEKNKKKRASGGFMVPSALEAAQSQKEVPSEF